MARSDERFFSNLNKILSDRERAILARMATPSSAAIRRRAESKIETEYRQAFAVDTDRILYSRAYSRYIDKTQVFYLVQNDHITHRVLHVQLVAKIARTIGRCLGLNEDLIEAIALGHDIGHVPFGHDGERFLSDLCKESGIGAFHHSVQGIQFLDRVERKGAGWNLCLQTLDGILCHDGEIHDRILTPETGKTFKTLESQINGKKTKLDCPLIPMTLEGCVMRMADTISYIGRDIEDAIRLNLVQRDDLPEDCVRHLGDTNGNIVYRLVTDLIENSLGKSYVAFSPEKAQALLSLKQFNYRRIYLNPLLKARKKEIQGLFERLFTKYLEDLERNNRSSAIFSHFLEGMSVDYLQGHCPSEMVRDFISGMTDRYFLNQCPEKLRPKPLKF
ncbi:MAG: phosphohydrolase [Deltaproteobacteria bacterium]|nr:MAG: phosphohydrolase [Deltaproteobacteria bacterium]